MNQPTSDSRWSRFRRWKSTLTLALVVLAPFLMQGEPDDSLRWRLGTLLILVAGAAYVIEELIWIAERQGRPCPHCGRRLRVRAFRLETRCPDCNGAL